MIGQDYWEKQRFVIVGAELAEPDQYLVLLSDYQYWGKHINELTEWCNAHCVIIKGMTLAFNDEPTLTAFCLRWT